MADGRRRNNDPALNGCHLVRETLFNDRLRSKQHLCRRQTLSVTPAQDYDLAC